jgi:hypothetical protein
MKSYNNPNEFDISLVQRKDQRQFLVEKMRGKLAGPSQSLIAAQERRKFASRKSSLRLGWKIGMVAAFLLGNFYWLSSREAGPAIADAKSAVRLKAPAAALDANEQAMYWACALYDFGQLQTRFGVPATAIVDANLARVRLREILPKADARTRFLVARMAPSQGGRP